MQEIRDQTLEEGQQIAEEVLYEVRFGELLDEQNPKSLRDDLGHVKEEPTRRRLPQHVFSVPEARQVSRNHRADSRQRQGDYAPG
jgi:molybdenum cofactor biosynthesis enzyme MoaA